MCIRQATPQDASRIAEILVYNNRANFYPIFQDIQYSFGEMQVMTVAEEYLAHTESFCSIWVYDDGVVKGFIQIAGNEIRKLYVDTFFQSEGIGGKLVEYAINEKQTSTLWALEKNIRAIQFYERQGFHRTKERVFEEGTTEYLVRLERGDGE